MVKPCHGGRVMVEHQGKGQLRATAGITTAAAAPDGEAVPRRAGHGRAPGQRAGSPASGPVGSLIIPNTSPAGKTPSRAPYSLLY